MMHSLTKYIGGHGAVIGGVIIDGANFDWTADPKRQPLFNEPDPSYGGVVWGEAVPQITGHNIPFRFEPESVCYVILDRVFLQTMPSR